MTKDPEQLRHQRGGAERGNSFLDIKVMTSITASRIPVRAKGVMEEFSRNQIPGPDPQYNSTRHLGLRNIQWSELRKEYR